MSHNSFGHLFRVTTFGESHGVAIGCIVDGCPPLIPLTEADIQIELDRRKPGQSRFTTQRREPDQVKILSGVFSDDRTREQVTTGTSIALMIENTDQRSKDYSEIRDAYRPGHADFTYEAKYGIRDYRGGGRSSARETAARVAAGGIAKKYLAERYGGEFQPDGAGGAEAAAARRSLTAQWLLFANASLGPAMIQFGSRPEELQRLLAVLDGRMAGGAHLLAGAWGDPGWGAADCVVQAYLAYIPMFCPGLDLTPYPAVTNTIEATSQRPAYRKVMGLG